MKMQEAFEMVKSVWESQATKNFISELLLDISANERDKQIFEINNLLASMSIICLDIKEAGSTLNPTLQHLC
jgi:hypothetical protein